MSNAGSRLRPSVSNVNYSIAGCSDHSPRYNPENIKVDRPHDLSSRWSSNDNSLNSRSWVLLELESPSILESITFGKYGKVHPCNLKDFEVHIGMSRGHLKDVLRSQLQNDTKPETFALPNMSNDGVQYPTRFVKIVCISAHGSKDGTNFNTSIWHIKLFGITDEQFIRRMTKVYEKRREDLSMRHILKHLRQRRHISVYRQLVARTDVELEHPLISSLYDSLVLQGDWAKTEAILQEQAAEGLFSSYIQSCTPLAKWKRLRGTDANGDVPSRRGGHAMCMDIDNGLIYLFGGYDGRKSLDDFWLYDIREDRWRLISHSVSQEKNGPGPRACHKMVFDSKNGCIYMLGRLADEDFPHPPLPETRPSTSGNRNDPTPIPTTVNVDNNSSSGPTAPLPTSTRTPRSGYLSEFYRYRTRGIDQGNWELLCVDTATVGGPKLVYDHQIVLDPDAQVIYVHGGRVVDGDWQTAKYSGLYSYDLRSGKWSMLQTNLATELIIPPRFGHSMTYDPTKKKLFIFAGQKDDYLSDMWEYDVPSRQATQLFDNIANNGGPEACFAHRAVLDPVLKEIYVFAGLEKTRSARASPSSNVSLYRYDTRPGTWKRVPSSKDDPLADPEEMSAQNYSGIEDESGTSTIATADEVPVARCAHQVVYDSRARIFYMHGGNGGLGSSRDEQEAETRLDDFWSMSLERPSPEEVIRKAKFEVRKQQFREMCEEAAPIKALAFLQEDVSSVVNHSNSTEASDFRSLLSHLLAAPALPVATIDQSSAEEDTRIPTPSSSGSYTGGRWTDGNSNGDEDTVMNDAEGEDNGADGFIGPHDSYELALRGDKPLSEERFEQRTKVFETLLVFVNSDCKQPGGSLLDILAGEL